MDFLAEVLRRKGDVTKGRGEIKRADPVKKTEPALLVLVDRLEISSVKSSQ
jgi:hypothetical protein